MNKPIRFALVVSLLFFICSNSFASAYDARPKLVVIIVVDQFRADYIERFHDEMSANGFRLLMDHGAHFTDCYYDYAITMTAPGHATLGTGTYSDGHGINNNEWWDGARKKIVSSVQDEHYRIIGGSEPAGATQDGASPHNLLADTLGDELKLSTNGKSRVFGVSLKDRAAILPVGFSANAAYWLDHKTGAFVTSTYYMKQLPEWVQRFNSNNNAEKYWGLDWKDAKGNVLRNTAKTDATGKPREFYDAVGSTPFANDYQFEFVRELISNEKLGEGKTTDLLVISLSSFDILGHQEGPNSPAMKAMTLALDRQLGQFFGYLGRQFGLANVWIALSADHGTAPMPEFAQSLRIKGARFDERALPATLNKEVGARLGRTGDYVRYVGWPVIYLNPQNFPNGTKEADAETAVGEAVVKTGLARGYFGKMQLATNTALPSTQLARRYEHSYSPYGGWYVMAVPQPFLSPYLDHVSEHYSPYNYNTHVPLLFFGLPFQPGTYRTHAEPIDLAVTLSSLLGINKPTHATGRVLTEALTHNEEAGGAASATQETQRP